MHITQIPFNQRMNGIASASRPEKFFNRLFVIQCTVRNHILEQ